MRIAISGTHCCGKSTLIDQFLLGHPDYAHEPEPYTVLEEDYGELFAAEPSADDFYRQLEFNVSRLRHYGPGDKVIYERSPADFLAYLLALNDLGREDASRLVDRSLDIVQQAIKFLDLIVFLPVKETEGSTVPEWEDRELRKEVNSRLEGILIVDEFDLFTSNRPEILEASGSTGQRLRMIEKVLDRLQNDLGVPSVEPIISRE